VTHLILVQEEASVPQAKTVVRFETPQGTKVLLADTRDDEHVRDVRSSAVATGDWAGYLKISVFW